MSHLSRAHRISNVSSVTFCSQISIRFRDDVEIPSFRANATCDWSPRNRRRFFASLSASLPICGKLE